MSTTPRPLLLSDHDMMDMMFVTEDGKRPSEKVRDFYEDLITNGKLRVMEEVEYSRVAIHMVGPHAYRCGGCGKSYRIAGNRIDGSDEYYEWDFCPGCGNKIKR